MTTVQLFHRIGRRARGGDFTKLGLAEQGDIAEAANQGLQKLYGALPAYFREMTEGFLLPAPVAISFAVTVGSAQLASNVFSTDQIGRTVVISGDPAWNQIIGQNMLLNPYNGSVSGTLNATVYGDAVYSSRYPFERIIGNPRFADLGLGLWGRNELNRINNNRQAFGAIFVQSVGLPVYWWVQMLGNSQGSEPLLVLKVSPVPDKAYPINLRMSYWPKRLTMADYDSATTLGVPDQFIEPGLIPLCLQALMSTPIWESKKDDALIDKRGADAEAYLRLQPGQVAAPSNFVGTPAGW